MSNYFVQSNIFYKSNPNSRFWIEKLVFFFHLFFRRTNFRHGVVIIVEMYWILSLLFQERIMELRLTLRIVLLMCVLFSLCVEQSEGICCPRKLCKKKGFFGCCGIYINRTRRGCNFFCCNCDDGKCLHKEWRRDTGDWVEMIRDAMTGKRRKRYIWQYSLTIAN